ncbi:MAG: hypothetical protein QOD26_989 [Betaproteobacteria bacterium]|jgi:hypothetical protein|nr:hypothetical protein [Betaproteobacteria bacterium]
MMRARIVSAAHGARWLLEGWNLFRAAPFAWLALLLAYWLLMTLVSLVPFLGVAVASIVVPAFSVGFMSAARAASLRANVELSLLFEGFRHALRAQLLLGAVYLVCLALVLGGSALADEGALARWMLTGRRPANEVLQSDDFLAALACAAALYAPVTMMFWFAPPLAAWHSASPPKALFYSFFACLMNWRAFVAYGAAAALVTLVLPFIVVVTLRSVIGGASFAWLAFPLLGVLLPTLFASFYASYRDVFASAE